ncbi:hypothetical protein BJY26_001233 [Spelaeicoccus albus]|uniref:Uncharacterized protein n=1 Tax=Spelaeicoccus albus TaxID=1280376 RepID=A0A7Z0D1U5_9MICO|nr:hypothetical protein [Spelaeicoccus albus]
MPERYIAAPTSLAAETRVNRSVILDFRVDDVVFLSAL